MFWLQLYFEELFNRTTVESLVKTDLLNEITTLVSFDKINTHKIKQLLKNSDSNMFSKTALNSIPTQALIDWNCYKMLQKLAIVI